MVYNLSIYSIPVYWILALYPHGYASTLIQSMKNTTWDNTNPKGVSTAEHYKKTVPAEAYARYERAEAASANLLENAPLFIGAVIIGNMAGLSPSTLNFAVGADLALRALYIALYINITKQRYSMIRSVVWACSLSILFGVLIKAGNKVAFQG